MRNFETDTFLGQAINCRGGVLLTMIGEITSEKRNVEYYG